MTLGSPVQSSAFNACIEEVVAAVCNIVGEREKSPLHEPEFAGNEWEYVKDCIDSGWVSSVGSYVDRFENMLVDITGASHAVAVVNGTAALHVALLLAGVRPGDEVLLPALTFIATANAVSYAQATPHFVDSETRTLGIDPGAMAEYLSHVAEVKNGQCVNRRTGAPIRAVIPMHTFGHPVAMDALLDLSEKWKIAVVEDAAEALGSFYKGRHCGTLGNVGTLSFNGNKVVTTGGGGAILTNDAVLAKRAKHLTTTARIVHRWSFIHDEVGFNYRLPNLNAALGCAQLERLNTILDRKRSLARRYIDAFSKIDGVSIVEEPQETKSNYWLVAMMLNSPDTTMRDRILEALNDKGIMARPVWDLMHRMPMFVKHPHAPLTVAEQLEQQIINLPSSPMLYEAAI